MAKVRISDVAHEAGVSLGTVSNALNHPDKVRPDTLELVNDAVARLGYVPNQAARQLAGGESTVLGLVLPRLDHAFSLQLATGAQAESRENGFDLLIASAFNDEILENHYMKYFLGAHIAGVLVQPMASATWAPAIDAPAVPVVYLDIHSDAPIDCVSADNELQGRLMARHALDCGARRIAVIGKASFAQLDLRVRGVQAVAKEAGVQVEVVDSGRWDSAADGFHLGDELASRPRGTRPDFILGLTDVLAAGAVKGVRAAGLAVPDDMLVAGCDGNPLAWGGAVPLTTIASPGYEIGRRGVRALVARIEGTAPDPACFEPVAMGIVARASTAVTSAARADADIPDVNLGEYL